MGLQAPGKAPTLTHALGASSAELVRIADLPVAPGRGRPAVWCPICGCLGEYVFSATPHFRHANDDFCAVDARQTALHRYLKALLRQELASARHQGRFLEVVTECWRCSNPTIAPLTVSWATEREEVPLGGLFADVAALADDSVRLVFEVCVTSPVPAAKVAHLRSLNVPLLEWSSDAFITADGNARWASGQPLPSPRTFTSPPRFPICSSCRSVPPRVFDAAELLENLVPSSSPAIRLRAGFPSCPLSVSPQQFLRDWTELATASALPERESLARTPVHALLSPSVAQLLERLERPHSDLLEVANEGEIPGSESVEFASAEELFKAHQTPSPRLRAERIDVLVLHQLQAEMRWDGDTLVPVQTVVDELPREVRAAAQARLASTDTSSKPFGQRGGRVGTSRFVSCERDIWRALRQRVADDGGTPPRSAADARHRCLTVITGGPGTGKTTSVRQIITEAARAGNRAGSWWVCAPTHKALARLRETTTHESTTHHTVHAAIRMLRKDRSRRPTGIVVDEASFLDVQLAASLFVEAEDVPHLVLVGDEAQLPSIGPGAVLRDVLTVFPSASLRLTQNHRAISQLAEAGRAMREGRRPVPSEALTIEECSPADVEARSRSWVQELYRVHPVADVQVLAATNKLVGALNDWALKSGVRREGAAIRGPLRAGDRAVVAGFDWAVGTTLYKGLVGTVTKDGLLLPDKAESPLTLDDSVDLQPAYALTVHKSQGSEWPVVLLCLPPSKMMNRNLVYTAFTRARARVVIVAAHGALEAALDRTAPRDTCLSRWTSQEAL